MQCERNGQNPFAIPTKMISIDQALALIEAECEPRAPCSVRLSDSADLVLAKNAASDVDSPPFDKALMDGFAVRASEGAGERQVVEEVTAGEMPQQIVTPGTAIRIMTGAPIPAGADAVIMVERTEPIGENRVRLFDTTLAPGENIMRQGESVSRGQVVLEEGTVIRPADIGILAESGCAQPHVVPQPTVAILATGNELVPASEMPTAGEIRNSNGPMLAAMADAAGGQAHDFGIARDDPLALRSKIEEALQYDVVVLSGGVSAGALDLVPPTLEELGVGRVFHKVAMKPGKPTWFGVRQQESDGRRSLVFGLPGNPVSGLVCFELLVRPALRALGGHGFDEHPRCVASLAEAVAQSADRPTFRPASLQTSSTGLSVKAVPWRGSADLAGFAAANALIVLSAGEVALAKDEQVEVVVL